jgi:UDP-sugar pyrophosphorylase
MDELFYEEGLVDAWGKEGKTHVIFLQDTNALVINSVVPTLGVSVTKGFHMNSICIPRLAGEAAGAITRLEYFDRWFGDHAGLLVGRYAL